MFRIGQKVVCVDASDFAESYLVEGKIYTVISLTGRFLPGLILVDAEDPGGWAAWRFRPVVERKTDIAIFTKMLNPESVNV